jgi:hypothetical protein
MMIIKPNRAQLQYGKISLNTETYFQVSYSLIEDCVSLDKLLNGGVSVTLDFSNLSSNTEGDM